MNLRSIRVLVLCSAVILSVNAATFAQESITETKLNSMLNSVDRAARKGSVAGIVAPMAKDVKIKVTIESPTQKKVLNLSKDQYAFYTREGLRHRIAYQLERKNVRLKVYEDGQSATITSNLYETLTIRGGTLRAVSTEVTYLTLREGKLLITSLDSAVRFY
jgi:hypothetical protein